MDIPRVAVVGSINVDITAHVERLPQAGETVLSSSLSRCAGGKGANQAAAVARLLGTSTLIGAVGEDLDGDRILGELADAGVDCGAVRHIPGAATGTALIGVDILGENNIVVHPGANRFAYPSDAAMPPVDAVLTQLEIDFESVLRLAGDFAGFLVINASPARTLPEALVRRTDLFVVNETEYELMPELAAASLVAVTYGADGVALFEHGEETARVPAHAAPIVINSVGAGDAFCAALTTAILSGYDHVQSLRIAAAVGADAVAYDSSQPAFDRLGHYALLAGCAAGAV